MRVSVPFVILLSVLTIGLVWWLGTKEYSFIEPKGDSLQEKELRPVFAEPVDEEVYKVVTEDIETPNNK